jgi:hypothetical protein
MEYALRVSMSFPHTSKSGRRRPVRAFTLIELLVVIAIIANNSGFRWRQAVAWAFTGHHAGFVPGLRLKAWTPQPQKTRIKVTQGTYWSRAELVVAFSRPALINKADPRLMTS